MANPRDWFRRKPRRDSLDVIPREEVDPFENGPTLEIGRLGASDGGREPAIAVATMPSAAHSRAAEEPPRRSIIPPPPPRESVGLRQGKVIEPSAFAVRPQVVPMPAARSEEPTRATPPSPAPAATPGFAMRRRAVPLARNFAAKERPKPLFDETSTVLERRQPVVEARPAPVYEMSRPSPVPPPSPVEAKPAAPGNQSGFRKPAESSIALWREDSDEGAEEAPRFTLQAPGGAWMRSGRVGKDGNAMNAVLREAFTPTRPKQQGSLFSGRYKQLQRIIAGIEEERAHIVLYGERGSGKTSLANVVAAKAEEAGYYVLRLACSSELSFDDIFREFLRRIPATFMADGLGATVRAGMHSFEELVPPGELGIPDLIRAFEKLHDKHAILIVDEYDRVTDEETKNKLAELIKNMSDASAPVTLLLIGVAEQVDELLGKHPSLRRTLVTVPLPLMTRREIDGIISAGEEKAGLRFDPEMRSLIVDFAQGLPYHAQLLCLFAARNAVRRSSNQVQREDLRYAVERAVEEAEGKIKDRYNQAIGLNAQGHSFKDVLFAAARCASDEFGTFTVGDVASASTREDAGDPTLALQYPLKKLTEPERGAVLRRIATPDGLRYQFHNQMMRQYVLVRQARERGII